MPDNELGVTPCPQIAGIGAFESITRSVES
jgi:hypothetical protein